MIIYKANIISPRSKYEIQIYENGALCVEKNKIVFVGNFKDAIEFFPNADLVDFGEKLLLPGFIDLHTHLPQYEVAGLGKNELLNWLNDYIFPLEAKFIDMSFAENRAEIFFRDLVQNGTTTACVYASSFYEAADIAFQAAKTQGIRVFMGNTMMDCNVPDTLIKTSKDNIKIAEKLSLVWHKQNNGLLNYILTPRFAGSCSEELMQKTAEIAVSNNFLIQTHLSENKSEIEWIKSLYPIHDSYTRIYDSFNIIQENTILAHSIYLSEDELELIHNKKASIAHCPCSNRFLISGIMPTKKYLNRGMKVGLGTDVAGGYSLSMLNEIKEAIENSKILAVEVKEDLISTEEALYMATLAGAISLGIQAETGSLEAGKSADFAIFDVENQYNEEDSIEVKIKKLIYNPKNYKSHHTFIAGKEVWIL